MSDAKKRLKIEAIVVFIISALLLLWFIPCIILYSAEIVYSLSVRVFGLVLIGVWIFRTSRMVREKEIEEEKKEKKEFRIY